MEKDSLYRQNTGSSGVNLPKSRFSLLSHLSNIDYCIELLREHPGNEGESVIGYFIQRSAMGARETLHTILPYKEAEKLKRKNSRFDYITIDNFLSKKRKINEGYYILNNDGLIVDLNLSYSHQSV